MLNFSSINVLGLIRCELINNISLHVHPQLHLAQFLYTLFWSLKTHCIFYEPVESSCHSKFWRIQFGESKSPKQELYTKEVMVGTIK